MNARYLEKALWRWALLATLLLAAFWLARASRYEKLECLTGRDGYGCFVMDRWSGEISIQRHLFAPAGAGGR